MKARRRALSAVLLAAFLAPGVASRAGVVEETAGRVEFDGTPEIAPLMIIPVDLDLTPALLEEKLAQAMDHLPGVAQGLAPAIRTHMASLPRQRGFIVHDDSHLALIPSQAGMKGIHQALLMPLPGARLLPQAGPARPMEAREGLAALIAPLLENMEDAPALQALADAFYDLRRNAPGEDVPVRDELFDRMHTEWIRDAEFQDLIRRRVESSGPRLGRMPPALVRDLGGEPRAFEALEKIASILHAAASGEERRAAEEATAAGPFHVSYLGRGETGIVYQIQSGRDSFTLKVYRQGSAAEELRTLAFFHEARDMKRGYAADVSADFDEPRGPTWVLSEFIPSYNHAWRNALERRGRSWTHEIAERNGILFSMRMDDQRLGGILIDPGGVRHIQDSGSAPIHLKASIMMLKEGLNGILPTRGEQPH